MALVERGVVLLMMMMTAFKVSHAAVHKVGDSAGWTIIGNVDYKKWAATKNFKVGDTISKSLHSDCCALVLYLWTLLSDEFKVLSILPASCNLSETKENKQYHQKNNSSIRSLSIHAQFGQETLES